MTPHEMGSTTSKDADQHSSERPVADRKDNEKRTAASRPLGGGESMRSPSPLLARFSGTDALYVKNDLEPVKFTKAEIPLVRFQQLEQQIRHAPAVGQPYEELAHIYIQAERWNDARRVLDAGIRNCPEYEPIVQLYEDLLLSQASQLLENAKNLVASNPNEQSRFEQEQAEINLINERIRVCHDRYTRHPEQTELLITWGIALRQSKRFEEAIDRLKEACKDLSLRARASLQIAMCYHSLDNPLEALSYFRRASLFRSPPPDPKIAIMALEFAAKLAEEIGLYDSAIYYLNKLQERLPEDATISARIAAITPKLPKQPES